MSGETPRLTRDVAASPGMRGRSGIDVPAPDLLELPERAIQFGTGALLRGLVDDIIDSANRRGTFGGTIVAVGSTGSGRDTLLNEQDGLFTLAVQGVDDATPSRGPATVQRYHVVSSVSRALSASTEWPEVLAVARDPNIELVFSNTTEVGIAFDEVDATPRPRGAGAPRSFPGKLAAFLEERAQAFNCDPARAVTVVPCELIEDNGRRLRDIVLQLARARGTEERVVAWMATHVVFTNTLVDRIVTGDPGPEETRRLEEVFCYRDGLITVCEPYRLLAIEVGSKGRARLGALDGIDGVTLADDVGPLRERKVRLLNGAHTTMVSAALLAGFDTVFQAIDDDRFGRFVRRVILEDILPTLDAPDAAAFAQTVIARLSNPYLRHALLDITLHGTTKMRVRVVPSIVEHVRRGLGQPEALAFGFAAYLRFLSGEYQERRRAAGQSLPPDGAADPIRALWSAAPDDSPAALTRLVAGVCGDERLWGTDLAALGFAEPVTAYLLEMCHGGFEAALDAHLMTTRRTTTPTS